MADEIKQESFSVSDIQFSPQYNPEPMDHKPTLTEVMNPLDAIVEARDLLSDIEYEVNQFLVAMNTLADVGTESLGVGTERPPYGQNNKQTLHLHAMIQQVQTRAENIANQQQRLRVLISIVREATLQFRDKDPVGLIPFVDEPCPDYLKTEGNPILQELLAEKAQCQSNLAKLCANSHQAMNSMRESVLFLNANLNSNL